MNGTQYALLQNVISFCIPGKLSDVTTTWLRKKLGLFHDYTNTSTVQLSDLMTIMKTAWPHLKPNEVIQYQVLVTKKILDPTKPKYPKKSSLPAKLNLFRNRIFEQTKLRKISSIGPQRLPERPKKPALPRKLPHAKMTLELYNQGVQLESEPESDDEPESDPDGKLRVVLSAQ